MATFIPNMTDVFPGSSEYNPDWNRIERMLKMRQNMYDEGARKLRNVYDSVFNSPMLRSTDVQRRDAYLKTITDSLNRVSGMDLSLAGNQQLATSLFEPVLDDNNIAHDIAYTKKVQQEKSKAEALRNSSDAETRRRYWDVGVRAMDYKIEEYQKANDDQALGMNAPKYVPSVDMLTLAEKAYKDAGISVKEDRIRGGYIWTKKNGDAVFPISQSFVNTLFSSDPGITDMLRTQAYVERKDFMKQNAVEYGGEEQAEAFYINNILNAAGKTAAKQIEADNQRLNELRARKDSWNKKIKNNGIIPGSPEHEQYLNDLEELQLAESTSANNNSLVTPPPSFDQNNIDELRQQADNLVIYSNYSLLTNNIARLLAFRDAQLTVKADPISLTQLRADLTLRNQKIMESIKLENRIKILQEEVKAGKYKDKKTKEEEEEDENPDPEDLDFFDKDDPYASSSGSETGSVDMRVPSKKKKSTNTSSDTGAVVK